MLFIAQAQLIQPLVSFGFTNTKECKRFKLGWQVYGLCRHNFTFHILTSVFLVHRGISKLSGKEVLPSLVPLLFQEARLSR